MLGEKKIGDAERRRSHLTAQSEISSLRKLLRGAGGP